jgi:hypothetical protein
MEIPYCMMTMLKLKQNPDENDLDLGKCGHCLHDKIVKVEAIKVMAHFLRREKLTGSRLSPFPNSS